jgi:plasmid stability protein
MGVSMTTLVVGELDPALVRRLHRRAASEGVSAQELHRRILAEALPEPEGGEEARPEPTGEDIVRAFRRLGELGLVIERDETTDPGRPPVEF